MTRVENMVVPGWALGLLLIVGCTPTNEPSQSPKDASVESSPPSSPGVPEASAPAQPTPKPAPKVDPPAPPSDAEIGTAAATAYIASAPDGHWVAFCQARADTDDTPGIHVTLGRHGDLYGDAMVPYLAIDGGEGDPLEAYVGSDPSGRFVAVVRPQDRLVLLDTWAGEEHVLDGARTDDEASPFGNHRAAAFSADKMAYARVNDGRTEVVVRDLRARTEIALAPGTGELWRFELDAAQEHVVVRMLAADTNGDGTITPPVPQTSLAGRQCRGPVGSYSTFGSKGDEPVVRTIALVEGAVAAEVPGAIAQLAEGPLARDADGAITLAGAEILRAKCQGEIVHVDPLKNEVWAACKTAAVENADGNRMAPLLHIAGGSASETGLVTEVHGFDRLEQWHGLVYAFDGGVMKAVNTRTGTTGTAVTAAGYPALANGDRLLFLSGKRPFVYDLATETRRTVKGMGDGYTYVAQGSLVAVRTGRRTTVYDFGRDEVLGTTKAEAIAVARSGHVLVAKRSNAAVRALPVGPLRWYEPK
ncbi:MAG: hypothetical protein AAF721_25770 [Myxococcota bacterium]